MIANHDKYFDEAYFQRGEERGTAYRDYARSANESPTFREIAKAIASIFRPNKCLEIGCATGAIVRNLNELGIEAYGVDVSEWAIDNRLHDNVLLAGAENLPFEDGSFDLIYSSHALEHIPPDLIDRALAEIDRVSNRAGLQFHMLPIVGTYPYDYDHDIARSNLRADPTHNILEPMEWWRERWAASGWYTLGMNVSFFNDTNGGELSSGQFTLSRDGDDQALLSRAFGWNKLVHRQQFLEIEKFKRQMTNPTPLASSEASLSRIIGDEQAEWSDYEFLFETPISVEQGVVQVIVELLSDGARPLRVALIDDSDPDKRGVIEFWAEFSPGLSFVRVPVDEFRILEGAPNLDRIDKFFFGGRLAGARFRILGSINTPGGLGTCMT